MPYTALFKLQLTIYKINGGTICAKNNNPPDTLDYTYTYIPA
jgi:hypothetical protein